jgi:predicted HAD superfamily Cof-like phosphohydrolase
MLINPLDHPDDRPAATCEVALAIVDNIKDTDLRRLCERSLSMTPDIVTCVKAFHGVYGMPIRHPREANSDFSHIARERLAMRFALIEEEYKELVEALDLKVNFSYSFMDEEGDWVVAQDLEDAINNTENFDLPEVADACEDLKYVVTGFELEMGIDPHAVLREVQASNLTKMGEDGKPIRRADGKILKGPNWIEADPEFALRAVGLRVGRSLGDLSTKIKPGNSPAGAAA